jgi:segregation and condensation protein A
MMLERDASSTEGIGPPIDLPSFSGPLDLLLHLIRANDLSIYDIPIALICDQYHDHLAAMQELDLDIAGEYLWMASWLLHLKSRMLLPRREDEQEDPRDELVERLLEYRRVKELAALLHDKDLVRRCLWSPEVAPDLQPQEREVDWESVDLLVLARTYLEIMQRFRAAHPPPLQVIPLRFRLQDTMREIYRRVSSEGAFGLLRDLHGRAETEEVVVVFVAALELVRIGAVRAEQRRPFAEIYLRMGDRRLVEGDLQRYQEVRETADGP